MTEEALFELLSLECRVDSSGAVYYYNAIGQLHRLNGPAIEWSDGRREWYQNGVLHRLDGSAYVGADGSCEWHIDGKELSRAEWQQAVASMEII